mgnify:CR=1 FL=1
MEELRAFWSTHPKYRDDLVNNIQGKFSFEERPQYGIIIKTSGGNRVDLSADNYIGMIESYVYLTRVVDKPGLSLEWVREDAVAIQNNRGRFPSPPGVYFVDIAEADTFYVDPLLDIYHEQVTQIDPVTAQLQRKPLPGTLRLFEMPAGYLLYEGVNYTLDLGPDGKPNGGLTLINPMGTGRYLQADYRYPAESSGPHPIVEMHANNQAIPGVVLAFGRRVEKGDQLAVVVQSLRSPSALEYGGKWELSLDIDVVARDVYSQQEIADMTVMFLWGILRSRLALQGIEITEVGLGGESEEVYDEAGDDYFYNASLTLTCQTDWGIHVPLDQWLRMASPSTVSASRAFAGMTDEELVGQENDLKILESLGLQKVGDPFWSGRSGTFPLIR